MCFVQKDTEDTETLKDEEEEKPKVVRLFFASLMSHQWPQTHTQPINFCQKYPPFSRSSSSITVTTSSPSPPFKSCPAHCQTFFSSSCPHCVTVCVCPCQVKSNMIQRERNDRIETPLVPPRPTEEVRKLVEHNSVKCGATLSSALSVRLCC